MKYIVSILKYISLTILITNLLFLVFCLYQQDWIRVFTGFINEGVYFIYCLILNEMAEIEWS